MKREDRDYIREKEEADRVMKKIWKTTKYFMRLPQKIKKVQPKFSDEQWAKFRRILAEIEEHVARFRLLGEKLSGKKSPRTYDVTATVIDLDEEE